MNFHDKFKKGATYMPHTLITYIFNIFSVFIKMAKNPKVIRKFKVENIIDPKEIKIGVYTAQCTTRPTTTLHSYFISTEYICYTNIILQAILPYTLC